jgi:membrane-associated phospholipid phosphatase
MRLSESIVLVYVAYVLLIAWGRRIAWRRRAVVTGAAIADATLVWSVATLEESWLSALARDWTPAAHLLVCYWMSGAFFTGPLPGLEQTLGAWDRVVFERWKLSRVARSGPRWLLELLELSYLCVYFVVPLGFGYVYWHGVPDAEAVDRYWATVLLAGLACYGLLPWLPTRPPHVGRLHADIDGRGLAIRRLNLWVLGWGSVRANTFPSGHAAAAAATALASGRLVPEALLPLLLLAISIGLAAVVGRYHYAADVVLGALVAIVVWLALSVNVAIAGA